MLEEHQADRMFYDQVKEDFGIRDIIILGLTDKAEVFQPEFLEKLARITDEILKIAGVIVEDVISFTTTDNIVSEDGIMKVHQT